MPTLSVLCFNCFGSPISLNRKKRFPVIAQEIEKFNPDIVMLQEVTTPRSSRLLDKELQKLGWQAYFTQGLVFRRGGLTMYTKKHQLKSLTFHPFTNQGPLMSWSLADRIVCKGFQSAVLEFNQQDILLINTHVTSNYAKDKQRVGFQKQQLDQIRVFINTQPYKEVILAGDLNFSPDSVIMKSFALNSHLQDTLSEEITTIDPNNVKDNWILNTFSSEEPIRVDYVLVSPAIRVQQCEVVLSRPYVVDNKPCYLSDHSGIYAQLNF
ncbi:MAG TPA: endonuclease/exonuclease/phosphatase family protein [Vitreimonas sp.]|nr:endonuclease/exonuclease/phosphatase family protein [Vitreimonas sp.]